MGRDADGQYVLQCHVAGQSMPVLVRRPASQLYVRGPDDTRPGRAPTTPSSSSFPSSPITSAARPESASLDQAQSREEAGGEGRGSYRVLHDPKTGKTYAIYHTPPRPRFQGSTGSRPLAQKRVRLSPGREELRDFFLSRQGPGGPMAHTATTSSTPSSPLSTPPPSPFPRPRGSTRPPFPGRDFAAQAFQDQLHGLSAASSPASTPASSPSSPSSTSSSPSDAQYRALCRLAEVYSLHGEPEATLLYLRSAETLDSNRFSKDVEALSRLGEAQHRLGQLNDARRTYQRVVHLQETERKEEGREGGRGEGREEGREARAAWRYGIALHDEGDPVGACRWYYRAIQLGTWKAP
jgi:hypothetical protein